MDKSFKKYFVYILRCSDGTLYTGYTNNLQKRVDTHNRGKGAKYTASRLPCELVYSECYYSKSDALVREYYIKHRMNRKEKLDLIEKGV